MLKAVRLSFMSDYTASKTLVMIDSIDLAFEIIWSLTRKYEIVPQKLTVCACNIFHKEMYEKEKNYATVWS